MELTRFEMKIKEAKKEYLLAGNHNFFHEIVLQVWKLANESNDDPALIGTDLKCPDLAG